MTQIIEDFILLDTNVISFITVHFAEKIYPVDSPTKLARYQDEMTSAIERWKSLQEELKKKDNVFLTPLVKKK